MSTNGLIVPDWPAAEHIKAFTTTIELGNFANHIDRDVRDVDSNRQYLIERENLPTPITWLHQVRGDVAVSLPADTLQPTADAAFTSKSKTVCGILTADCLPLLVCQRDGHEVAAIHAGWQGLLTGVIDNTIKAMSSSPNELLVWMGPAIGADAFEIGNDLRDDFLKVDNRYEAAFKPGKSDDKSMADIYQLARLCLNKYGVEHFYGGEYCTYHDEQLFYSYRRQGHDSGRMYTAIWMTN